MIYLDHAAGSWPKPPCVAAAMSDYLARAGGSPGRSGHPLSLEAGRTVFDARQRVAGLLGLGDPLAVVFTKNATEALNLALLGLLRPGHHVVTSTLEHNSVLRPLRHLEGLGVAVTRVPPGPDGLLDPARVAAAFRPDTRLLVLAHASNVTGALCPVEALARLAAARGVLFCLDAAQTAGVVPLEQDALGLDLVAFTGHKGLLGPQGTGGLGLGPRARELLQPLLFGGTGSASDSDLQPAFLPDAFEAGTLNGVGLAGLAAALAHLEGLGVPALFKRQQALTAQLLEGLRGLPGLRVLGPADAASRVGVVSFNLEGWPCSDLATALEERAGICCRPGLHCAPLAHRHHGTFPEGALRLSLGWSTTPEELDTTIETLALLASNSPGGTP